jgi:O-antigen/teichoic acid export membrane protein
MGLLKKLASETALYGLPSILGRSVYFLLVILHTHVFAARQSGVMNELFAWVAFANVVYTYGMETSFFRFAGKGDASAYYRLILTSVLLSSLVLSSLVMLFSSSLAWAMGYAGKEAFLQWLAVIVAIDAIVAIPLARLRLESKAKRFALVRIGNIFFNVGFNLFFLVFCRDVYAGRYLDGLRPLVKLVYAPEIGVGYVFLSNLLSNLLFFPMLWPQLRDFRLYFNWTMLEPVLSYGFPILIMGLAGTLNQMFDRTALKYLLPENFYPNRTAQEALGIYGSVYKLSVFMNLAVQAFRYAAEPFFFSRAEDSNAPRTMALVMKWFLICCCAIWVGVSTNLSWLAPLFLKREEYLEGVSVVPLLLLGNLMLGIYYNLSFWFKLTDKTQYGTYLTFLGAGLNLAGNVLLIPYTGYYGCAMAFALSSLGMVIGCYVLGERHYPVPYPLKRLLCYLIVSMLLIMVSTYLSLDPVWLKVLAQGGLCLAFAALVYGLEKDTFLSLASSRR